MSNPYPQQPNYSSLDDDNNTFWEYLQSLNPEMISQLSKPNSPEVLQLIQKSIVAMLGNLPQDRFNDVITTSRDELGRLLGSAMVDGYFLRNAEQRLEMEKNFQLADVKLDNSEPAL
jgi:hypothetical protein